MTWFLAGLALLMAGAAMAAPPGYTPFWSDEFNQPDGARPSSTRWTYDLGAGGWGNAERQTYVNDAAHARVVADPDATDGKALQITATREGSDSYKSARLKTQGLAEFQYGYIEARLRIPYGQGIWPAFWMLGTDITSVSWPQCGEIDVMENIGREPSTVHGTLHGPGYSGDKALSGQHVLPAGQVYHSAYHTFAVHWRPDAITFLMDGKPYHTRTRADLPAGGTWVFEKPFFLILNLAVGGRWPGYPDATTVFPQTLRVDYVRAFRFMPPVGRTVTLASAANGRYVTAGTTGASAMVASKASAGASERFLVEDAGAGRVALKSVVSGKYVTATNETTPLAAIRSSVSTAETFLWVDAGVGNVALKSVALARYVCAENAGANPLLANRTAVGTWEAFRVGIVPEPGAALSDAVSALAVAAGTLDVPPSEADRLNIERGGASAAGVDIMDAARFARHAAGLDTP